MNSYFYKIFLPHCVLTLIGLYFIILEPSLLVWTAIFWLILGPIGLSIGFHRLFAHRQFQTYRPIELILAIIGTLAAYGPLLFWVTSHACHHKFTDTDKDPTSPSRGFWHSVITWNLKKQCEQEIVLKSYPSIQVLKDPVLMYLSKYFFVINYLFLAILLVIDFKVALSGYILATYIERIRIGFFINYLLHSNFPGTYKVKETTNNSKNLVWLYPLTAGFSLHNQHHAEPTELKEKTRWWEVDIEYWMCKLITKP